MSAPVPVYSRFETELAVRPDDIDMNRHVHNSHYFDYVLAARYDQMSRCYKMSMEEFLKAGFSWVAKVAHLEYKRPLGMGDVMIVRTWIARIFKDGVKVHFEIDNKKTGKLCCSGWFDYTMINIKTGRAEAIPAWITEKYS
ncbi:MAG TPA: thioesterase family protein, partial [Chthoniobacteraceae bacterium]|nr:thioesterase family protein [Chthoniobacteraceae bacterium]